MVTTFAVSESFHPTDRQVSLKTFGMPLMQDRVMQAMMPLMLVRELRMLQVKLMHLCRLSDSNR